MTKTILFAALLALLTAGCYTQLYRPEGAAMGERGRYDQLYNRYDSSAIDTTLTKPEPSQTYPEDDYGWYYWGHSRYPRWGFDFGNFSPSYYWTYYGYYDYYSVPWWSRYYDPWYNWGWSPPAGPSEPPSRRDYGRREQPSGGGGYAPPPSGGGSAPPATAPASPPPPQTAPAQPAPQTDPNHRSGRRGR